MSLFSSAAPTARRLTLTAGALFAAATFASPAEAAFTTGKCGGDNITAAGASFATNAHQLAFGPNFANVYCADSGTAPTVTYTGSGSGAGRQIMGARTVAAGGDNSTGSISRTLSQARFAGTDEPVTPIDQANMNKGSDAVGDEGTVRTLPLAIGSVAIIINVPNGCAISTQADGTALTGTQSAQLSDPTTANTRRLQIKRTQLEQIYAGGTELDTWGELIPWINDGNGTAGQAADTRCQSFPLVKIRRLDDSGTTYAFKDYLATINPSRGWLTTYNTPDTRTWPNDTRTVAFDYNGDGTIDSAAVPNCGAQYGTFATGADYAPSGQSCKETSVPLLQTSELPSGTGGGALVNKVNLFDGAIGYADLATARTGASFAFERQANSVPTVDDDKYWTKIESKDGTTFVDPQSAANGFVGPNAVRGSNCATAVVSGTPTGNDPSLGSWVSTSAVNSTPKGYGLCSLTYALAWDDYATPYALIPGYNAANEERKAKTVRDYLESALTTGQLNLNSYDYAPLPATLAASTLTAVRAIGFAKSGGGGGTNPPVVIPDTKTPDTQAPAGNTVQPPAAVVVPSNLFTVGKPRSVKGAAAVTVQVPGAGTVSVIATSTIGKKKKVQIASAASTAKAGGPVALTLKPNSAAAKQLKKAKKLKVDLTITFTPSGGQPKTSTVSVTLKPVAVKKATKKK